MENREPVLLKRVGKMANAVSVDEYISMGGFEALKKAAQIGAVAVIEEVLKANLRGRGGAAYPMGKKWEHLYGVSGDEKYIVCNADEGEPGTFKDRVLLESDPLSVIEGMIIAGFVFRAKAGYIYIRGEYRNLQQIFQMAVDEAQKAGYLGENIMGIEGFHYHLYVVSGSGAYVCGENSALLNSIEGKSGRPRTKPPHLAEVGLYGKPTLVNNVESFACVPVILEMGGEQFCAMGSGGSEGSGGTKLVALSGHIKNRGVYEVYLGTPLQEILYSDQYGGGSSSGNQIKFCHFGGQSGPIGYLEQLDINYSYEDFWQSGLAIGSGAIVVLDSQTCIVHYVKRVMEFFAHESCGKCTPCRIGLVRVIELLDRFLAGAAREGDLERLEEMLLQIQRLSACGLGQSAGICVTSALKCGRPEFEALIPRWKKVMIG